MSVTLNNAKNKAKTLACHCMQVSGQLAQVADERFDYDKHILLRVDNCIVNLNDPRIVWRPASSCVVPVELLPPGTSVTYVSEV